MLPFLIQFWMFATPVIFPSHIVPEGWRWALALNPMAPIVDAGISPSRTALTERPIGGSR